MAEFPQGKNRKRKHFEMEKPRQSPFQNPRNAGVPVGIVSKAPRGINAAEFAESRAMEIHNMMHALSSAANQTNKRVFQSLPRHMRRRAASHNPKRMPVRLRDAYNREASKTQEKQKETSKQKKSRRHRRKHSNLLAEYSRRQRKHAWLETHIWHAKRFKMVEQWGYKIPLHPNDKSVRASYRAMVNDCLLQDVSYYQCIEIYGRQEMMVAALKHLTSSDVGPTMAAKDYLDGRHEGHTVLYRYDQCPNHAIGPVKFLWQSRLEVDNTSMRRLWLWSHPMCSDEVVKEIVHACSLEGSTKYVESKSWLENKVTENTEPLGVSGSTFEFIVTVLHEQVVRLRLTGPKSHALLASTLQLCDWNRERDRAGSRWWEVYSDGEDRIQMLEDQNKSWEQMKGVASAGVLKAGSVLALVVKDPRLGLPVRKSSVDMASEDIYKDASTEESTLTSISESSVVSPLWNSVVRKEVKQTKMPEKELNNLRSNQAMPGSNLDLGDKTSRIPILVIQQPGNSGNYQMGSINFGSGYDVILPAGWSMAFWIAFVYRGARVGGTRELETCSREQGVPYFPRDFPDTEASREYNEEQKRLGEEKYKRYPPAKRPNYQKFGIASPYGPDWGGLVNEWSSQVDSLENDTRKVVDIEVVKDSEAREIQSVVADLVALIVNIDNAENISAEDCLNTSDIHDGSLKNNGLQSVVDSEIPSNDIEDPNNVCEDAGSSVPEIQSLVEDLVAATVNTDNAENISAEDCLNTSEIHDGSLKNNGLQSVVDSNIPSNDIEDPDNVCEDAGSSVPVVGDSETTDTQFNVIRKLSTLRRLQNITLSFQHTAKNKPHKHKIPNEDIIEYLSKTITVHRRSLVCLNLRPLSKGCPENNAVIYIPTSQDLIELQKNKSYAGPAEHVHKCNNISSVIGQCSRKAIGWVTSGQYSFARGQGSGIGFCTFPGFCELITRTLKQNCSPVVLVRNTSTFQYRFASVIVV